MALPFYFYFHFILVHFRTDCFCNEFFSFCARDIEGLTDNEIPTLPNSCFISSKEDTTTVTSKPEETSKLASKNADTKNSDDIFGMLRTVAYHLHNCSLVIYSCKS